MKYVCEYCGRQYADAESCKICEDKHKASVRRPVQVRLIEKDGIIEQNKMCYPLKVLVEFEDHTAKIYGL